MLDSKLQHLKDHLGISTLIDWQAVRPEWVVSQDGIGPRTLEYLRLLLASHDLTLKGDKTPEFWKKNAGAARQVEVLGNELIDDDDTGQPAAKDRGIVLPWTALIDTAEQQPYSFQGLRSDADNGNRPLIVPIEYVSLGRSEDSYGDYSLDSPIGGQHRCHIERKSMADAHSTILGWARKGEDVGRRDRFEKELANLSEIEAGLVLVECDFPDLIANAPQYGTKTAAQNAKTLHRSITSWMRKYSVQWLFCGGRRLAEKTAFRWLCQWYDAGIEQRKADVKEKAKRRQAMLPVVAAAGPVDALEMIEV